MGSLERGGADEVINLPVEKRKGDAPGCLRGPCGPFSARGFCLPHLPPRSGSQLPSDGFGSLFVILSGCFQGPRSLCLLLSTCSAISRSPFSAQPEAKRTLRS